MVHCRIFLIAFWYLSISNADWNHCCRLIFLFWEKSCDLCLHDKLPWVLLYAYCLSCQYSTRYECGHSIQASRTLKLTDYTALNMIICKWGYSVLGMCLTCNGVPTELDRTVHYFKSELLSEKNTSKFECIYRFHSGMCSASRGGGLHTDLFPLLQSLAWTGWLGHQREIWSEADSFAPRDVCSVHQGSLTCGL